MKCPWKGNRWVRYTQVLLTKGHWPAHKVWHTLVPESTQAGPTAHGILPRDHSPPALLPLLPSPRCPQPTRTEQRARAKATHLPTPSRCLQPSKLPPDKLSDLLKRISRYPARVRFCSSQSWAGVLSAPQSLPKDPRSAAWKWLTESLAFKEQSDKVRY